MELAELKKIANEMGYQLVKKPTFAPKKLPCPACGGTVRTEFYDASARVYVLRCKKCNFSGDQTVIHSHLSEAWNRAVERYKGENNAIAD